MILVEDLVGYFGSIFIPLYPAWTTRWLQWMINLVLNLLHFLSDVRISGSQTQHAWYKVYLVISTCNKVTKLEKGHRNAYIAYYTINIKSIFTEAFGVSKSSHFYDFFDWEFRLFPSEIWLFLILRGKKSVSSFFFPEYLNIAWAGYRGNYLTLRIKQMASSNWKCHITF